MTVSAPASSFSSSRAKALFFLCFPSDAPAVDDASRHGFAAHASRTSESISPASRNARAARRSASASRSCACRLTSPVTHSSAVAPASAATRMNWRASSRSRHHDAETVCTCVEGSARASIGPRRATRGSHERDALVGSGGRCASAASVASSRGVPSSAGDSQCGRCGCTTPVNAGCANACRCASHATYGLRSRNTRAARVPGRNAADAPSAPAIVAQVATTDEDSFFESWALF